MNRSLTSLILIAALLLPATAQAWDLVEADDRVYESRSGDFEIEMPVGWRFMKPSRQVTISRDGPGLHAIIVRKEKTRRAFRGLEGEDRDASADMLPEELAEAHLADVKARSGIENLELVSEEPFIYGDSLGFRMVLEHTNDSGLKMREVHIGFVHGKSYYKIMYFAPQLHYFERDLAAFEAVVESFRVTD